VLERLCTQYGIDARSPLSERDLCFVVAAYPHSSGRSWTTIKQFLSALVDYTWASFARELPRGRLFQETMAGLEHYYGHVVSQSVAALTIADLQMFARALDLRYFEPSRDWCACLLAFFGLLRVKEYMGGALRFRHAVVTDAGVDIIVLFSKTQRTPTTVSLTARPDALCPRAALLNYRAFFNELRLPNCPDDPLFITKVQSSVGPRLLPLTDRHFIGRVRGIIAAAIPGRTPADFAGHSFRRGGATAMALAGVDRDTLKRHGRWQSDAYMVYIDAARQVAARLAATSALLP
jgi:hypothetical protein